MGDEVTILYFSWLRQRTGCSQEALTLPDGVETVAGLMDLLSARSPAHQAAFRNRLAIRCSVNREFADPTSRLRAGDEVAFFPPITGG